MRVLQSYKSNVIRRHLGAPGQSLTHNREGYASSGTAKMGGASFRGRATARVNGLTMDRVSPGAILKLSRETAALLLPSAQRSNSWLVAMGRSNPAFERTAASALRLLAVPSSLRSSAAAQRER
jgi:hypothetical protein